MGRHTRITVLMLLVMLLALTGCEKKYTGGDTETESASDTEIQTDTETEKETNPATVRESVETEKVTEANNQNKKVYESDLGYSVIYDESLFENNRKGDYDEIGMKGQTFSSKPVFFAAMKIKNEDIPAVMEQIFDDSAQETTIGTKEYSAICQPTIEEVSSGKELKYHNQYLVQLANGDALLFEVQWFGENKDAKETETAEESETVKETKAAKETQSIQETAETVKETAAESETESSKAEKAEETAANASRKLAEMLDSIEINVPVKGEAIQQSTETVVETETAK